MGNLITLYYKITPSGDLLRKMGFLQRKLCNPCLPFADKVSAAEGLLDLNFSLGVAILRAALAIGKGERDEIDVTERRMAALVVLCSQGLFTEVELVKHFVADPHQTMREACGEVISEVRKDIIIQALIKVIGSESGVDVRQQYVYAFKQIFGMNQNVWSRLSEEVNKAAVFLNNLLCYDGNHEIKKEAALSLAYLADTFGNTNALRFLFDALDRSKGRHAYYAELTRTAAAKGIEGISHPAALAFCRGMLETGDLDILAQKALMACLGNLKASELLCKLYNGPDVSVRNWAGKVLEQIDWEMVHLSPRLPN